MWREWNELTIKQRAQADVMFSADVFVAAKHEVGLLELRQHHGYFVNGDGVVICRRIVTQITDWQATSHLEG